MIRRVAMLCAVAAATMAYAQTPVKKPSHDELVRRGFRASPAGMAWWRDAKFGVFVHWGVGTEKRHSPWANRTDQEYWDTLYARLKGVKHFDAEQWMKIFKSSGAKYIVFMTRQNGAMQRRPGGNLTLWDSKFTDNKLTREGSPFKRDACKEIAEAAHKANMELEWYYCGKLDGGLWELLSNYGPVRGVWFDGVGVQPPLTAERVLEKMRTLQPDIVTNAYLGGNPYGGDYGTPQHWYPKGGWAYSPVEVAAILRQGYWYWDTDAGGRSRPVKSLKWVIDLLVGSVGRGHNVALNMAPKPDGSFEANEIQRMKEVGDWLAKFGRSVFATRPGPYPPAGWGVSTRDKAGKTLYLHLLRDIDGGTLSLAGLDAKVVSAKLLNDPSVKVQVAQTPTSLTVVVPADTVDPLDTVIALELATPAAAAKVLRPAGSLTTGKTATATQTWTWDSVGCTFERNGPHNAVDGDPASGWCSSGKAARTLTVDLGSDQTVTRAIVSHTETLARGRKEFQGFRIEALVAGKWARVFDSGSLKGPDRLRWRHEIAFSPVSARQWRITVWGGHAFITQFDLWHGHLAHATQRRNHGQAPGAP